jgi:NADH:ubiquinone reductase (H+-translocating)
MARSFIRAAAATGATAYALRRWHNRRANRAQSHHHQSESMEDYRRATHRILILGAGFGGIATALELDRLLPQADGVSVLVVDRDSGMLVTPLLWTVADGRSDPNDVVVPVRGLQRGRRFHLLHAAIERIDLDRREVITTAGVRPYDSLVIALGSVTSIPALPGLREHAHVFHTPADALQLRNHVIEALERAHQTDDPASRQAWLTFVVGGGGDTGIELAATIHDYIWSGLLRRYPWLTDSAVRIVVVGRAGRLVPMSDERTSAIVRRVLEASGIEVWTGVSIEAVTEHAVITSSGEIPARTIFWAAGIAAPPVVRELAVEHAGNGAIIVDDHLCISSHPDVFVIGDAAWAFDAITRAPVPPTGQAAQHQGKYVARAIAARLAGRDAPVFRYKPFGHLALLGHRTGVAEIGPLVFTGWPAWLVWHGTYLLRMPSWRNRIRLVIDWTLSGLTGRASVQLPLDPHP